MEKLGFEVGSTQIHWETVESKVLSRWALGGPRKVFEKQMPYVIYQGRKVFVKLETHNRKLYWVL